MAVAVAVAGLALLPSSSSALISSASDRFDLAGGASSRVFRLVALMSCCGDCVRYVSVLAIAASRMRTRSSERDADGSAVGSNPARLRLSLSLPALDPPIDPCVVAGSGRQQQQHEQRDKSRSAAESRKGQRKATNNSAAEEERAAEVQGTAKIAQQQHS